MKTVKIGQGMGDILSSIPYIKMLGGQFLYMVVKLPNVPDWHPVNHGGAELLVPFLRSQGLDGKVIPYQEQFCYTYDIDMDARVQLGWDGSKGDIYTWNSLFYGVYPDMTKPFFDIGEIPKQDYIVITRTARYPNQAIDYSFLNTIDNRKLFVGTEAEYTFLHQCFPSLKNIEYRKITDMLDAAIVIKGSKVFISNQTSMAVLAEGLAAPRVLEVCPGFPSVIPKTPNGRPVITQRFFEQAILEFLK